MMKFKARLRQQCRQQRNNLSLAAQQQASAQVCLHITRLTAYQQARKIGLYCATDGEINLTALWNTALDAGKECYFPQIDTNKTLRFLPATSSTAFALNGYGIAEPVNNAAHLEASQLDILFLPLVAFDCKGNRLGMGGGYYDRSLAQKKPSLLIGAAYEFQKQAALEPDPWDISLDAIVTPKTIYWSPS